MAKKFLLEIYTPDKLLLSKEVESMVATSVDGEFGVLYGHVPLLTSLAIGELRFRNGKEVEYAAVAGGFAEVAWKKVTILAETAELARHIDADRAERARERAEQRMKQAHDEHVDYIRAETALKRAMLRIKVVERAKGL